LLLAYADYVTKNIPSTDDSDKEYYTLGATCIEHFRFIDRTDILFTDIFDKFKEVKRDGFFLELLEPFLLSNKLKSLNPEIMQLFIEHYAKNRMLSRLEQCIVHLDIGSLDFQQVATLCRKHHLFQALMYIYNCGVNDYITPLEDMLTALSRALLAPNTDPEPAAVAQLANTYLMHLFAGTPMFNSPLPNVSALRSELVQYLFFKDGEKGITNARFFSLLRAGTRDFLALLHLIFEEKEFTTNSTCQAIIDILITITSIHQDQFDVFQLEEIFMFIADFCASGTAVISPSILSTIFKYLLQSDNYSTRRAREQTVLNLLKRMNANSRGEFSYDIDELIQMAEGAEIYEVAEYLYNRIRNFKKVISCRVKGPNKESIFDFIKFLVESAEHSAAEKSDVKSATITHLRELLIIDSLAASRLIIQLFAGEHERILNELSTYPELQYVFLGSIMSKGPRQEMTELLEQSGVRITPAMHELYVKLMIQFSPETVYSYLVSHDSYPLDSCLRLCQQAKLTEATMYLLERTGDVAGALALVSKDLDKQLTEMVVSYESEVPTEKVEDAFPQSSTEKKVQSTLSASIALCQRNSSRLEENELRSLWFSLFDVLIRRLRHVKAQIKSFSGSLPPFAVRKMYASLTTIMRTVLTSMMGNIALPSILSKIVSDNGSDEFGDFKFIILEILDNYTFERAILHTANRLIERDMQSNTQLISETK